MIDDELENTPVETNEEWQARKLREKRIRDLQQKLNKTDHKTFSDYEPKEGEVIADIIANRSEWRCEIRQLQADTPDEETITG